MSNLITLFDGIIYKSFHLLEIKSLFLDQKHFSDVALPTIRLFIVWDHFTKWLFFSVFRESFIVQI